MRLEIKNLWWPITDLGYSRVGYLRFCNQSKYRQQKYINSQKMQANMNILDDHSQHSGQIMQNYQNHHNNQSMSRSEKLAVPFPFRSITISIAYN